MIFSVIPDNSSVAIVEFNTTARVLANWTTISTVNDRMNLIWGWLGLVTPGKRTTNALAFRLHTCWHCALKVECPPSVAVWFVLLYFFQARGASTLWSTVWSSSTSPVSSVPA